MALPTKKVVVTERGNLNVPTVAETSTNKPDVLLVPLSILRRISIRAARVYIQSVLGVLGYSAVSTVVPQLPFQEFSNTFANALLLAIGPTVISILVNLLILFTKLDESQPELMA